jgi:hypothetical protein
VRKGVWAICFAVLVLCALLLMLGRRPHQSSIHPSDLAVVNSDSSVRSNQPDHPETLESPLPQSASIVTVVPPVVVSQSVAAMNSNALPQVLATWQAPIEFYGKVIDENNTPLAGARITFHWVEVPTPDGNRSSTTQSDANGLFSLQGARGPSLDVSVVKEGYYTSRNGLPAFRYGLNSDGTFSADSQNPAIFRLRKMGHGVDLITSENGMRLNVSVRVPKDNTPVRVDFFRKETSAAGQLEISQEKPPWKEASEWSFRMSIPTGGLIENEDEFQFEAPENNYQPTVNYHFSKSETNWTTSVTKQFYIAFGQPRRFGWLRIESNLAQETIFLTYAINPSGSRNLEPAK